jgi:hypothetical protein
MKKTVKEESNADAIRSALAYCQAAIKELERMKLSPTLDAEKIKKMKKGIPDTDIFSEYTGEKSLPRVNIDPFAGMASDSELDWRRDNLMEKAKKILKR